MPETFGIGGIDRVGRVAAAEVGRPAQGHLGLVAILEIAAAHALEQRRGDNQICVADPRSGFSLNE